MTLRVTYDTGKETTSMTCESVDRDDKGVFLYDSNGRQIAFIPFRALEDVSPADD